ncbi:MAG: dTMP kinase [Anaerolineae bacterium]
MNTPGLHEAHHYPGKLIVVEGIDGSGKSTQAQLLQKWLTNCGIPVFFTEWNSSKLVRSATKAGKKKNMLTPTTFSLLHATDFADRLTYQIIPPLKAGMVVIADRYAFTAFARDTARGVDPQWVRDIYSFAVRPDISFYFKVSVTCSLTRLQSARAKIKFYEAGLDLNLSRNLEESFCLFQGRVLEEYDKMVKEFGLMVINAELPIDVQQQQVRHIVEQEMGDYLIPSLGCAAAKGRTTTGKTEEVVSIMRAEVL